MVGHEGRSDPESTDSGREIPLDVLPLHSTNLLTVLDEGGIIQYESPSIERIFGFSQSELVGEQVAEYFHPDDRERVVDAFYRVVTSEEYTVESVEFRHQTADGSYRWVESVASANPTPDGHYVVNTRDISDSRAQKAELEQKNHRLEEFASVVSHDLRNPLNVAAIRTEQARRTGDTAVLDDVKRAHDRMESLVDDLLTLARAGTQVADREPVALGTLTESCWQTVVTDDATLVIDTDRQILADRSRLRQLLENLLRNAVEHGGRGVTVTVEELAGRSGFAVADDGPGVPPSKREQIFDRGWSTTEGGTGFGLTITEEIASAHGWDVRLTESDGGGARIEVVGVELQ